MTEIKSDKKTFRKLFGNQSESLEAMLNDLSPALARVANNLIAEFYSKEDLLDLRTRELIAIATLATQGSTLPQLKAHIEAALNVGCSKTEIEQVLLQLVGYIGLPKVINAMKIFKEVIEAS